MNKIILLIIGILSFSQLSAQGYDISVKVNGLSCDEELLLANHFGDKQYIRDTSECVNGEFHFKGENPLESGIYLIVLPDRRYFEVVISAYENQNTYGFETDTLLEPDKLVTKGSIENKLFYGFNKFAAEKGMEAAGIREAIESAEDDKTKKKLQKELSEIGEEVKIFRQKIVDENPATFIAKVYKAMREITITEPPVEMTDSLKRIRGYMYLRKHFWDNIDNGEDGLVRTPIFHRKLKEYFDNYVPPVPDTSIAMADELINRMEKEGSSEQFKYTIHFLLTYFQKSKYMCFDKALYHITNNYYCSGRAFWADSSLIADMCEQSRKMGPTLCDLVAPEMNMPDTAFNRRYSLHSMPTPVTVLVFWDINCGHCKKEMPIIKQYYDSANHEEVSVYAVYTQGDWQGWKDYIKEKELNFLNVANAFGEDDFRKSYNIISTPQIYILDKDKKIRFKKIAAKDIHSTVQHLLDEEAEVQ
ncbi:MAG: redoxin domain-containing protein [Bacteroidia bacterium]